MLGSKHPHCILAGQTEFVVQSWRDKFSCALVAFARLILGDVLCTHFAFLFWGWLLLCPSEEPACVPDGLHYTF